MFKFWEMSLRCLALFSLAFEAYEFMVFMFEASIFHSVVYFRGKQTEACYITDLIFVREPKRSYFETVKRNCTTEENVIMSLSGPEQDVFSSTIYPIHPYYIIGLRVAFWIGMVWITCAFYSKQRSVNHRLLELATSPLEKFHFACKNGDQESIRKLFYKYQSEIPINEPLPNGNTVLHEAIT